MARDTIEQMDVVADPGDIGGYANEMVYVNRTREQVKHAPGH